MPDQRLNSVHLQPPRRESFRAAREALLGSQGTQTLAGSLQAGFAPSPTAVHNLAASAPSGAQYALVDRDYTYPLKPGMNTVGRLPDNDVVIPDPYISRRHCAIVVHSNSACELHDIASKNGTLVNGRPLNGPTPLKSGDEILMCERLLVFVAKDDAAFRSSIQVTRIDS
jgi:hypothetical protein